MVCPEEVTNVQSAPGAGVSRVRGQRGLSGARSPLPDCGGGGEEGGRDRETESPRSGRSRSPTRPLSPDRVRWDVGGEPRRVSLAFVWVRWGDGGQGTPTCKQRFNIKRKRHGTGMGGPLLQRSHPPPRLTSSTPGRRPPAGGRSHCAGLVVAAASRPPCRGCPAPGTPPPATAPGAPAPCPVLGG
jgi:hypothetical protein